ncbi:iron ABC transporter permease [Clostridium tertium]|uniref:FecCD family ABC transporter permease n=1 Tax=Clostridium tertium TaxID=1559 RepID=UPI00232CE9F2|nr:iron ABC transporter permease [Clostridium tertium]MDB1940250.1 iron ABC transporter permease [Clostridium tertium]MDB1954305.1 iron ABC transporter permease [Clostridium tertium]MDB1957278.1 iron ABC transporter permease [Clostridium tertium]MDB1963134.1 iron ABC transporter permease [Clostridium tertium]MDB1965796.1 iron ABC transporter permease [Clostridium tertium]
MNISKDKKSKTLMILSMPLVILIICIGTSIGSSNISIMDIISIILHKVFNANLLEGIEAKDVAIIWSIRLPRVLLAFTVGGALAASGAVVQSVLKNPLASPYTLGVSSGASLGVGLLVVSGISIPFLGNFSLPLVGFISSLLTMIIVLVFASKVDKELSNSTIILSGMVFSLFFNAALTTITALFTNKIEAITMWQMGSFSMRGWSYLKAGIPFFLIGIIGIMAFVKEMDVLTFGEEQAKSIGVEAEKVKKYLFLFVAILTGAAVSISGTIGFVDLIAPHIVRKIFGSKHSYVIPMSIVFGGCLMVITDLISRTIIVPSELPVGAVTAIIGAPFFAYLYFKKSK